MDNISPGKLIENFKSERILVVGDVLLDIYIRGEVERISPEAPVPVVLEKERIYALGGAGNVAANAAALGGKVTLVAICGNDPEGKIVRRLCAARKISGKFVSEHGRPTSLKTRPIARRHQLLRIDREISSDISGPTETKLISLIARLGDFDYVIAQDYSKGCLTPRVMEFLKSHFGRKKIIIGVKPGRTDAYHGVFVIVLNLKEAHALTGIRADSDATAAKAAKILSGRFASSVVLTRGERGITTCDKLTRRTRHIPTRALHVYDVTGAGDTVLATLTLMLGTGAKLDEAADVANHAAGIVVGVEGTATVTLPLLKAALVK